MKYVTTPITAGSRTMCASRTWLLRTLLVIAIFASGLGQPSKPRMVYASSPGRPTAFFGAVITIGALLVAGKLAKDGIDDSIGKVGDESRALLQQARAEIERIITLIEKKYQDNLNQIGRAHV